jgi:hypothetical protein
MSENPVDTRSPRDESVQCAELWPVDFGRAGSPLPAVYGSENRRTLATASKLADAPYFQTVRRAVATA